MKTLNAAEAAALLGIHPVTVRERAAAGRYPGAFKEGRAWMFTLSGLEVYAAGLSARQKAERRPEAASVVLTKHAGGRPRKKLPEFFS